MFCSTACAVISALAERLSAAACTAAAMSGFVRSSLPIDRAVFAE
jgi:hypothetical protein